MRIKKEFLNEQSLEPYGFEKEILYGDPKYVEYWKTNDYCSIFIQRGTGEIAIYCEDCDSTDIDDAVYHLIVDGLVEI